jgi:hypothetical protein
MSDPLIHPELQFIPQDPVTVDARIIGPNKSILLKDPHLVIWCEPVIDYILQKERKQEADKKVSQQNRTVNTHALINYFVKSC